MPFKNLIINRAIIHEVFKRSDDRAIVDPYYGASVIALDSDAKDALQVRITSALGHKSHGIEMAIRKNGPESTWQLAKAVMNSVGNDHDFVAASQRITAGLAAAQTNRNIPGGIIVVIEGTVGYPAIPLICVIKAEPHGGFTRKINEDGTLLLQFLKDLILTPQAKLYKIGAFLCQDKDAATIEHPTAGWSAFIFDDLITSGNRQSAAQYFYETFLGLDFPSNSAWQTKQFHTLTKSFIRTANLSEEKKSDLLGALTTYLKTDQTGTIQVATFADAYLPEAELKDAYSAYMQSKEFPLGAIHKDLSEVSGALRRRQLVFSNDIRLSGPAEHFQDRIRIRTIDGDATDNGIVPKWTQIVIMDRIRDQE